MSRIPVFYTHIAERYAKEKTKIYNNRWSVKMISTRIYKKIRVFRDAQQKRQKLISSWNGWIVRLLNTTSARSVSVHGLQQQAMESRNYFGNYTLSQSTLDKLKEVDKILERDSCPSNPAWAIIRPKQEIIIDQQDDEANSQEENPEIMEEEKFDSAPPSTQFFFSQNDRACNTLNKFQPLDDVWSEVAESLCESLENTNATVSLVELTNLSDTEVHNVVNYMSTKLSMKGTYNLCNSVCTMNMDQSMVYIKTICSNLLLPKIIDLQQPSRLMTSSIIKLVEKFPEDIQEFIYIPILNSELKDTTVVMAMISSFPNQLNIDLIMNFHNTIRELKEWHIDLLSQLITEKLADDVAKEKLLKLLLEKASSYSRDKNYGKFIQSFVKLNHPFTDDQITTLSEIVAVNESIFKRRMESLLKNKYFHAGLWHIS